MFRLSLCIFCIFFISGCSISLPESWTPTVSAELIQLPTYQESLDPEERVNLAKKRKSYISGIRKGDYYSLRNNPEEALAYYLQVAEKIPNDQIIRKKIAHVYSLQKNWKSAYENYIQVPIGELSESEVNEMFQSLFFDDLQLDRIGEILKFPISRETQEYYRVVDVCYTGIHNCIITIEAYSGTTASLLTLQTLSKSAVFITPDYQYRNITIAAKFYEYGMYGASMRLAREILENRPDYLEGKKILAFSLAELGKYQEAKKYLLEYSEKNPDDLQTIVRLGEVYASLGDIVSSNLSLNNAILSGYTPKTDLERRLAYNYHLLGDTPALMRVMNYLLQEEDVKEDDYAVGISLALAEGDIARARNWAVDGLKKFEDSSMILPLYIESLRLSSERDYARIVIENTPLELQRENPNFLLQKALITFEYEEYESAREIFEELSDLDEWPDIQEESRAYIESIDRILSEKE